MSGDGFAVACAAPREPGQDTDAALAAWGFPASAIERLRADGVIS